MRIGILAVQGAFMEHANVLDKLGVEHFEIRQKKDLEHPMDGMIFPGGESTVIGKLIQVLGLYEPIKILIERGMPVFGTCAGLLLLAGKISNDDKLYFATMGITARRNAYGRQLGSFRTVEKMDGVGQIPMVFIRAPYIESVSENTKILAKVDGNIVAARQENMIVTSFHPELTQDTSVHEYFIQLCREMPCETN